MRVLMLAPQPYFSHRGTPMNVRAMLSVLSGAGVEVDLVTYPLGEDTPMPGLRIRRVWRPPGVARVPIGPSAAKLLLDAVMVPAAWRMARRGGYDLVHAVEESVYLGLLLKRRFGLKLIYDMDSSLREQMGSYGLARAGLARRFMARMEEAAVRGSDAVITVCRALTEVVRSVDPRKPVHQIEDIPLEAGPPETPSDAARIEERLAGREVILYTGNFEPYQGLPLLLGAMPAVLARRPKAALVLVGGSEAHIAQASAESRRLGIEGSVLMPGPRPPSQMGWFMERAAVLASPRCTGVNTPLKIYTYLQSGRPVVATRLPTHTQVLEDGWAVLVEPEARSMAEGILRLLEDPALARALAGEGRRVVEERYSREGFASKLLAAYRELCTAAQLAEGGQVSRQAPAGRRAAVFLDRDGVVNRRLEADYVTDWSLFEFLPGAAEAIRRLNALGYPVVVVSNQQGIAKGLMSERDLEEIHRRMTAELASLGARLEGVYHCPHLADAGCACRKPMPGLILRAASELGLDPACSWMVGDSPSDLEAGRRAGCRPVLIGEGDCGGCPVFSDLLAFATALEEGSVGG